VGGDVLQPDGVAVRRGSGDEVGGDGGAGAGLVFHDDLLAELARKRNGERPGEDVGDSARGEAHHEAYGLARIVGLRVGRAAGQGEE
jgi:hypothetical protein